MQYFNKKLTYYILFTLSGSILLTFTGGAAPFAIPLLILVVNQYIFKGELLTLFFAFTFLHSYSLVWGGDNFFVNLPNERIDVVFTQAGNYLGYIMVALLVLRRKKLPHFNRIDLLMLLFFLLMMLSPITAGFASEAPIRMIPRLIQFITLYFLTRTIIQSQEDVKMYFQYMLAAFIPVFVMLTLQYFNGYFGSGYGEGRPGDIVPFLPYVIAIGFIPGVNRLIITLFVIFSMFIASFHGSRRTIISMVGYLALFFRVNMGVVFVGVVIYLAWPLIVDLIPKTTVSRLEVTFDAAKNISEEGADDKALDKLGTGRWSLLQAGLQMWENHPIFGIGLKNNAKYMDDFGGKSREARIHNYYAETLVDLGVVGLLVLLLVIYNGFISLNRIDTSALGNDIFLLLMVRAYKYHFIMIHIVAFFGNSMFGNKATWIVYALIGSISSFRRKLGNEMHASESVLRLS